MADQDLPPLTDDEQMELIVLLKRAIDADRYPLSPRIRSLKTDLAKLEGLPVAKLGIYKIRRV